MKLQTQFRSARLALATATALVASLAATVVPTVQAQAQTVSHRATSDLSLSQGRGQLITLNDTISDVMVSNPAVADVQVRSPRQIYVYAKSKGESTIFATTSAGRVVYSANVRVASNLNSVSDVLAAAMPEANLQATTMNGLHSVDGNGSVA